MRTARPLALGLLVLLAAGGPLVAHAGLEPRTPQPTAPRAQPLPPGLAPGTEDTQGDFRPPPIQGHVTDMAGVLSASERAQLEARLEQLRRESGYEVAIFVPTSLQGETIEDVAYETFQAWRLGQAEPDNGVLLVVAPAEHRLRIETGKGVGGELTDLQANRIIRDSIAPRLRANDWAGALTAGADGIARALTGRPLPAAPGQTGRPYGPDNGVGGGGPVAGSGNPLMCLLFALIAFFILSRFFGGPRGGRRRRGGGIVFVPPFFGGGWRSGGFGGRDDGFRGGGGGGGYRGGGGGESGGGGSSGSW